ncbi:MAG TPA: protein kinase [Gemmatimonadales bacterium]|nr:protein kinase [Gemmatimonadales bacterium]
MHTPVELQSALAGRYTIERELGRGGWATVYLAHDTRHDRPVALKILRPDLAAALGTGRFLREIAIAGRLTHPHVLPLYDSGTAGDSLFYVMPYIEGETLRRRLLREQQLPLDQTLAIALQVAEALAFAHAHNVLHRDIKPENILLEGNQAYIADFGIARAIEVSAEETLSEPGLAIGTPAYMSPEQATGGTHLDGRSDLYSLACVIYEMLTGEPPHTGPTAQAILARQQSETPRSIRVLRPAVPEAVEQVIMKALAKAPADRFGSVSDLADALTGAVGGPRAAPGVWPRRALYALAVVLGIGGVAWLATWTPSGARERAIAPDGDPTHVAVLYLDDLSENGMLRPVADGLTEDLIDALGQVGALRVVSPNGVRPYAGLHMPPDSIARVLGVGTLVGGSVDRSGDVLRVTARLIDARSGLQIQSRTLEYPYRDLFALQEELAQEVSRFLRERLGREILLRERRKGTRSVAAWEQTQLGEGARESARTLWTQGDASAVRRLLDMADSQFAQAASTDPNWADPVVLRGWVAVDRIELSETVPADSLERWYREGLAHAERGLRIRPQYPPALELRGTLRYRYWVSGNAAGSPGDDVQADLRAGAVKANPAQARALGTLSALLQATGQLAEANLVAARAYEADAFLSDSPQILFRLYHTSLDLGREREAVRWCDTGRSRFPEDWRFTFCQLRILALADTGRPDVDRAWSLVATLQQLGSPAYIPRWHLVVASLLARAGLRDSAEAVIKRARAAAPGDSELDFYEAEARMLLGDHRAALRLLERDLRNDPGFRAYLRVYPLFRPLWNDPGFQALVAEPGG